MATRDLDHKIVLTRQQIAEIVEFLDYIQMKYLMKSPKSIDKFMSQRLVKTTLLISHLDVNHLKRVRKVREKVRKVRERPREVQENKRCCKI